jgi:hypothetical protein
MSWSGKFLMFAASAITLAAVISIVASAPDIARYIRMKEM